LKDESHLCLAKHLPAGLREDFVSTTNFVYEGENDSVKFFREVDKTDPIIGVWRHIHLFRDRIDIEQFIEAMADFFDNPGVAKYCVDEEIKTLRGFLQNKDNARAYFSSGLQSFDSYEGKMTREDMKYLLEERSMHFIE